MASFNKVVLVGNTTRDIEVRHTPGGAAVCDVGLAVNDKRKNQAGEWVEETSFIDITIWGRTAEVARDYLSKGSQVLIEGRLKQETWEKDGQKHSKIKVICEKMQLLGSKNGGSGESRGGGNRGGQQNREYAGATSDRGDAYEDENIPF